MEYYAVKLNDKGTIAVDDTILVKNSVSSAGSYMLDGFKSLFSAEAVERLEEKVKLRGARVIESFIIATKNKSSQKLIHDTETIIEMKDLKMY